MGNEKEVCRKCGHSKEKVAGFYKVVGKPPWRDDIYVCDVCYKKMMESKSAPLYGKAEKIK